jgi:hypothetical protein
MKGNTRRRILKIVGAAITAGIVGFLAATGVRAATLTVSPASGTFVVGSTFNVSILLDTENETVNAVELSLLFPPDKLQVVSPSTGQSIVDIWTGPPSYNNQTGVITLRGGIPGGINVSKGLVTTLTFLVTRVGRAALKFGDQTRVLLHDGKGTDALREAGSGVYELVLPPPAGPIVASETHPDPTVWYPNPNPVLRWAPEGTDVQGYSYVLDDQPITIPDDISEGLRNGIAYRNLADGRYYFHIKALRAGAWGGTTHFALNIDTTPPAEFPITIIPQARTTRRQPVVQFATTDLASGIDHYALKIIPLSGIEPSGDQPFFIEAGSPFVLPELTPGKYDVIVRAYDRAGNFRDVTQRLTIVNAIFLPLGERGFEVRGTVVVSWRQFWLIASFILAGLGWLFWRSRLAHRRIALRHAVKELPEDVRTKLEELKRYRSRYGQLAIILLLAAEAFLFGIAGRAQTFDFGPPIVTDVSRDISNREIFYIGGKTDAANATVVIYLQNPVSGETLRFETQADKRGEWFYRHTSFLAPGTYRLWTQTMVGDILSPPSPQLELSVRQTAIQVGATRISYDILYLILLAIATFAAVGLGAATIFHAYSARKKQAAFLKEIREAEESIRRGFAILRRDIEAELRVIRKARLEKELAAEKERERQLLEDLEKIERHIGKEIWEAEEAGRRIE